jgi:hypothetical protein
MWVFAGLVITLQVTLWRRGERKDLWILMLMDFGIVDLDGGPHLVMQRRMRAHLRKESTRDGRSRNGVEPR